MQLQREKEKAWQVAQVELSWTKGSETAVKLILCTDQQSVNLAAPVGLDLTMRVFRDAGDIVDNIN